MTNPTNRGFGRLLIAVYAVFAISATARSLYQLATDAGAAPVPYTLSAVAAIVYCIATWALGTKRRRVAWWAVMFELVGILAVGAWSYADPDAFPEATVWSHFGQGYGFVPLVLPFVGLWWLRRSAEEK